MTTNSSLRGCSPNLSRHSRKTRTQKRELLQKVLSFIADERADAMIAAAPYIGAAVQQFV